MSIARIFDGDATAIGLVPPPAFGLSRILKNNPWRDKEGKYTTKDKATYQGKVFGLAANSLQDLVDQHGGDYAKALATPKGKAIIKEMGQAFHKVNQHTLDSSGFTANLQAHLNDTGLNPAMHSEIGKKVKGSVAAFKAWQTTNQKKAQDAVGDEYPGLLKKMQDLENEKPTTPGFKAANTKAKAKLQAQIDQKLSFWKQQYESSGGDPALFDAAVKAKYDAAMGGIGQTKATGVPSYVTPAVAKKPEPVAAPAPVEEVKVSWKDPKDKADALAQNSTLGIDYYKKRTKLGQDHPETQAAYAEWQKSKDWLKANDPGIDIGKLSGAQKQAAAQALNATKAAEEAQAKALQQVKDKITKGLTDAAYEMHMAQEMGNDDHFQKAKAVHDKFLSQAHTAGLDAKDADAASALGVKSAVASAKSQKMLKDLMGDKAASVAMMDSKKFIDLDNYEQGYHDYQQHQAKQAQTLTKGEQAALREYTGAGYKSTNKTAAAGGGSNTNMASAMKKMTLGQDVRLKRNAPQRWFWESFGITDFQFMDPEKAQSVVGRVYTEKAYSSTSKNLNFNSTYSAEAQKTGTLEMNIRAHKDIRGFDVHDSGISSHSNEKEVILDKGVTYVIRGIKKRPHGTGYIVDVDAIGHL